MLLDTNGIDGHEGIFTITHNAPEGKPLLYSNGKVFLKSPGPGKTAIRYDRFSHQIYNNDNEIINSNSPISIASEIRILSSPVAAANAHIKTLEWVSLPLEN